MGANGSATELTKIGITGFVAMPPPSRISKGWTAPWSTSIARETAMSTPWSSTDCAICSASAEGTSSRPAELPKSPTPEASKPMQNDGMSL